MSITIKMLKLGALLLAAQLLAGCGGADSTEPGQVLLTCNVPQIPDASGTQCIDPPPIYCPAPQVPTADNEGCAIGKDPNAPAPAVMAGPNQAVLFYKRSGSYDGYKLHTWNNESCNAYAAGSIAPGWESGLVPTGFDDNYGVYWVLELRPGYAGTEGACGNFIVHVGTDDAGKDPGPDMKMPLSQEDPEFARMNWIFSGVNNVFEYPVVSLGVSIQGAAAHWIDQNTFIWNGNIEPSSVVKLYSAVDADLAIGRDGNLSGNSVELMPTDLTDEQKALVPHLADKPAFKANFTADEAKAMVKNQLALAELDADGELLNVTYVQAAKVLDDLYTKGDADADEATLGISYSNGGIKASVWAPTARSVALKIYDASKTLTATQPMTLDPMTGIWSYSGASSLDRMFYRYELSVYHTTTRKVETVVSTDPYSLSLSRNGQYSQFVNLNDDDLKPEGWAERTIPTVAHPEDIVVYEGHVRDFSVRDQTVTAANRGKYLAFTEMDSAPVMHLKSLQANGLTHFHLLPLNDQANINEDASKRVDITDTVAKLCKLNASAPVCGNTDANATIQSVLESYQPFGEKAQELVESMRSIDGFNWGYDPQHFIAPEGSYASNPEGVARIKEVRAMNKALNDIGLRTVLDVVYNHTSASGLNTTSVFDKIVPGYYHRLNESTGSVERSTCCENTATEHRMFDKFMQDSLLILTRDFGFNDFRFDIMGHTPKASILAARDLLRTVNPTVYFYGEGWNFGEVTDNRLFVQAKQIDMAGTEVGTFNDRLRDAVRDAVLFSGDAKDDNLRKQDLIRIGLAGTLKDYVLKSYQGISGPASSFNGAGYAEDPADIINYVSKHDNETLWDKLQYGLNPAMTREERVRSQNIAIAIPLMSQGVPFMQMGSDMLRSKSMDRDSYDSGDWFNFVDFSMQSNNFAVGLPLKNKNGDSYEAISALLTNPNAKPLPADISYANAVFKEFLSIRAGSPLFRLTTAQDVIDRVGFHNIGKNQTQGLIVMSIDDGTGLTDIDPMYDAIVLVINGTATEKSHTIPTAAGFDLHPIQQASADTVITTASFSAGVDEGTFTVPAYSMAVFVKAQGDAQGAGLSADATTGAPDIPPYEATTVFVRGGMNGWGESDAFTYDGEGVYTATLNIDAGDYQFKVASSDWATVNLGTGAAGGTVTVGQDIVIEPSNDNLNISIPKTSAYVFRLDANNKTAPTLTVSEYVPYGATTVFLRGGMNGWGEADAFEYVGSNIYSVDINITSGSYQFKVASSDWATVNLGAGAAGATVTDGSPIVIEASNDNLSMTFDSALYNFKVDATNKDTPELTVTKQ